MFKLIEECGLVRFLITSGTQKEYECPICGSTITYFSIPPCICSYCFSDIPNVEYLRSNLIARASWHINELEGAYKKVDNFVPQEQGII